MFSEQEVAEVVARYPALARKAEDVVEGVLEMNAQHEGRVVVDRFTVQICETNPNSKRIPALYEIGGRTKAIAEKHRLEDRRTLHQNPDGTACVCVKQAERKKFPLGSRLIVFVEELAVPYLYGLSRFEKDGKWPWGDYSHGPLGLLEYFADDLTEQHEDDVVDVLKTLRLDRKWAAYRKQLRNAKPNKKCTCCSGKPFKSCHDKALKGIGRLREEVERLSLGRFIS